MAKRGRPALYKRPEDMEAKIDEYLARCAANEEPVTLTGAMLHLGIYSYSTLYSYAANRRFSEVVKKLRMAVEHSYERRLYGQSPTGAIFALKNFGWSDRQELQHTSPDGSMTPTQIVIQGPDDEGDD